MCDRHHKTQNDAQAIFPDGEKNQDFICNSTEVRNIGHNNNKFLSALTIPQNWNLCLLKCPFLCLFLFRWIGKNDSLARAGGFRLGAATKAQPEPKVFVYKSGFRQNDHGGRLLFRLQPDKSSMPGHTSGVDAKNSKMPPPLGYKCVKAFAPNVFPHQRGVGA